MSRNKNKRQQTSRRRSRKINRDSDSNQTLPDDGPPKFLIEASVALNAGLHNEAIAIFEKAIPENSLVAYSGIGDIYLFLKENEKALEWLEKALESKPNSPNAVVSIARDYLINTRMC